MQDVEFVMGKVLTSKEFAWIFENVPDAYSEMSFLYDRGASLVSGIIDRVVIKGDTGYVVDYKAIRVDDDESLAAWKDHYRPQVEVYCEAVKEIFNIPHVEGYLLFLDSARLELTASLGALPSSQRP